MNKREADITEIKRILTEKDSSGVDKSAFYFINFYPRDQEILLLLCQIFESDWHKQHEDLASAFQSISNPITAKSLFNVAFSDFKYCNWNEYFPLQRKCTWALADIGTPEAKDFLEQIQLKANETIAGFAAKRLENWESELSRKGQIPD